MWARLMFERTKRSGARCNARAQILHVTNQVSLCVAHMVHDEHMSSSSCCLNPYRVLVGERVLISIVEAHHRDVGDHR